MQLWYTTEKVGTTTGSKPRIWRVDDDDDDTDNDNAYFQIGQDSVIKTVFFPAVWLWSNGVPVSYTHLDVYKRQMLITSQKPYLGLIVITHIHTC